MREGRRAQRAGPSKVPEVSNLFETLSITLLGRGLKSQNENVSENVGRTRGAQTPL